MKTTLDIPDTLYRKVKAKSALEGMSVRRMTIMLYTRWTDDVSEKPASEPEEVPKWFACARSFIDPSVPHDMDSIRASIVEGRRRGASR